MGSGMSVRPADFSDIAAMVSLVYEYADEVVPGETFSTASVASTFRAAIGRKDGAAFVSGHQDIAGMIVGFCEPSWWSGGVSACPIIWFVRHMHRARRGRLADRLVDTFETWAAASGAQLVGATFTGKDASPFFVRRGYRPIETRMVKVL